MITAHFQDGVCLEGLYVFCEKTNTLTFVDVVFIPFERKASEMGVCSLCFIVAV